jgi:hypothetical protein
MASAPVIRRLKMSGGVKMKTVLSYVFVILLMSAGILLQLHIIKEEKIDKASAEALHCMDLHDAYHLAHEELLDYQRDNGLLIPIDYAISLNYIMMLREQRQPTCMQKYNERLKEINK